MGAKRKIPEIKFGCDRDDSLFEEGYAAPPEKKLPEITCHLVPEPQVPKKEPYTTLYLNEDENRGTVYGIFEIPSDSFDSSSEAVRSIMSLNQKLAGSTYIITGKPIPKDVAGKSILVGVVYDVRIGQLRNYIEVVPKGQSVNDAAISIASRIYKDPALTNS